MEPILYHGATDGCAFGAIVALEWLCRPCRLVAADGEQPLQLHAGGQLQHGCRAILRHIGAQRRYLLGYRAGTEQAQQLEAQLDFLHEEFQAGTARMILACDTLNRQLAGREWLDGNKRTVADACLVAVLRWAQREAGLRLEKWPRLEHHVRELHGDPAVFFADAIESQRPAVSSGRFRGHCEPDQFVWQQAA